LTCLGAANAHLGNSPAAIASQQRAAALAAQAFGADGLARITADTRRASELEVLGSYREELELREELLERARRHFGEQHIQTADAEAGLGACLQQIGDYTRSRSYYESAEKTLASLPEAPLMVRVRVGVNFANVLQEIGDEEAALARYNSAYALVEQRKGSERLRAVILANTGNTEFRMGRYADADAHFQLALALREQADGKQSPGLAYALEGLGSTALAQRHFPVAEQYFRRALALREVAAVRDHSQHTQLVTLRFGIAMARWGQGDLDEAFDLARQCAERVRSLVGGIAANLPERQSVALREQLAPATALVVTLAAQRGDAASVETAWRLVMLDRGMIGRTEARRLAEARASRDPALADVWQAWRTASAAVADSWLRSGASDAEIDELRNANDLAERRFWDRIGSDPNAQEAAPALTDIAHALPGDGVLVAMAEGVAPDPAWPLMAGRTQLPEDWYAFTLGADGKAALTRLGRIASISAQAHAWQMALRDPGSDAHELARRGAELRTVLLDPLHVLEHPHRLFFVPDGELFRLSLEALPVAGGFAVERGIEVHTLSNESELLLAPAPVKARALLAGAPQFAAAGADAGLRQVCAGASGGGFHPLPHAQSELTALRDLLGHDDSRPVDLLIGADATKQKVIAALPEAGIVHLATHGFSIDQSCAGGDTRSVTVAAAQETRGVDPMALSGLAFAGASADQRHAMVGVLSAGELASLDLSGAAWVVLSACDSGLGPIGRNEGVFGMRRALRLAGAHTVIMSLWEVDDASTAELMRALYHARFDEHADVPGAMAAAMRSVIDARRAAGLSDDPYYWAAFVSEGGWR
jgi:CHAT domain-containing protein/tetratricopeptide (TPR) repeat protein